MHYMIRDYFIVKNMHVVTTDRANPSPGGAVWLKWTYRILVKFGGSYIVFCKQVFYRFR